MKNLLLSACLAAVAFWVSDAEAMKGKTVDGQDVLITRYQSIGNRYVAVSRWELGNIRKSNTVRSLFIDYRGTGKKSKELGDNFTKEMEAMFCTLPNLAEKVPNLSILSVYNEPGETIDLKILPDSIGSLKSLQVLDLSRADLETLPDSIGNLENLEELDLSSNHNLSKLPDSIGNLKKLKVLNLEGTNLRSLPKSLENLTNLTDINISKAVLSNGTIKYENYSLNWRYMIIKRSFEHWFCTPPASNNWQQTSLLDLSGKGLTQIPFGVHMITGLKKVDVSNNQLTKIPYLLKSLHNLETLYIHNNSGLNSLPDFLWKMKSLKELKIDWKLIKYLPEDAKVFLGNKNLKDNVPDLILAGKNNKKMNDEELESEAGPYTVHLPN